MRGSTKVTEPLEIPLIAQGELLTLRPKAGEVVTIQLRQEATESDIELLVGWWEEHIGAKVPVLILRNDERAQVTNP